MIVYRQRLAATLAGLGSDAKARRFALNVAIALRAGGQSSACCSARRSRRTCSRRPSSRRRSSSARSSSSGPSARSAAPRIDSVDEHAADRRARSVGLCQCLGSSRARAARARPSSAACCSACRARPRPSSASSSSIPTLLGAGAYSLWKERALLSAADLPLFLVGLVVLVPGRVALRALAAALRLDAHLRAVRVVPDRVRPGRPRDGVERRRRLAGLRARGVRRARDAPRLPRRAA